MKLQLQHFALLCFLYLTEGFYSSNSGVIELDSSSFHKSITGSGLWLVEFYAPWCGHCKNLVPVWKDVGAALGGIINVAAVDADSYKDLAGEFGVQGFPSIKFLTSEASGKIKAVDYQGDRSARGLIDWGLKEAKKVALKRIGARPGKDTGKQKESKAASESFYGDSSDVITLTDSSFHEEIDGDSIWLVEFYAPWCGHCKNLKPEWEELASRVKGKVKVGAVDCTVHKATCQEFGVQGYPTIKMFGEDKDFPSAYQGGRDSSSLIAYAIAEWKKSQPPPEAKELVDQHVFERECLGDEEEPAKKLCLVAFLPNILDSKAAGRQAYIKILSNLADKFADRPFSYLWAEGGSQQKLENSLGVGGYGYPAFVALSPKDAKYASLREAFDSANANQFVDRLRTGHERVSAIEGGIPWLITNSPWDGGEGEVLEEEEFSLEDLMKESSADRVEL